MKRLHDGEPNMTIEIFTITYLYDGEKAHYTYQTRRSALESTLINMTNPRMTNFKLNGSPITMIDILTELDQVTI